LYVPGHKDGGRSVYGVRSRLSYSHNVPRYQVLIERGGGATEWVVGHMEKTETHMRVKPGEFIRVQVWRLTCNTMVWEKRRSALYRKDSPFTQAVTYRPTPSNQDTITMGMTIATQGFIPLLEKTKHGSSSKAKLHREEEHWVETVGVEDRTYSVTIDRTHNLRLHTRRKDISKMRIHRGGERICTVWKQRFAGALGAVEHPLLGVQIESSAIETPPTPQTQIQQDLAEDLGNLSSYLDKRGLLLLLMSLAWSEETISDKDSLTPSSFAPMYENPYEADQATNITVQWDTNDTMQQLNHIPYLALHDWNASSGN